MTTMLHPVQKPAAGVSRRTGVALLVGAAATAAAVAKSRSRRRLRVGDDALESYLEDHLSGANAAIQVVEGLRRAPVSPADRGLFEALFRHFTADREVVRALLAGLTRNGSPKRAAASAAGKLIAQVVDAPKDSLALLRVLEMLSIGIQGKRCMWRAFQRVPQLSAPGRHSFAELEASAVAQWEAIERRRCAVARRLF